MKQSLISFITIALAVAFSASCQKEVIAFEDNEPQQQQVTEQPGKLLSATRTSAVPAREAAEEAIKFCRQREWTDLLEDYGDSCTTELFKTRLLGMDLIDCEIVTYKIHYASRAIKNGELVPATMTGEVSFIIDGTGTIKKRYLESVTLLNTIFNTTAQDIAFASEFARLRVLYNALYVFPYYQGGDKAVDDNICAPVDFVAKGRQAIDCELAALELIESLENVSMLPCYYTENIGLSNGGGPALASQYLLENDAEYKQYSSLINLRSTYLAEGHCCNTTLFPNLLMTYEPGLLDILDMNKLAPLGALSVIASTYTAWKDKYFEGIDVEEYFSEEFLNDRDETGRNKLEVLLDNDGSMTDAMQAENPMTVAQIINPELIDFNPEDSTYSFNEDPRILKLYEAFEENDFIVSGWSPKTPLVIAHSFSDEFLYYKYNYKMYCNLSHFGLNDNVELKTVYGLNHILASTYFLMKDVLLSKHQYYEEH